MSVLKDYFRFNKGERRGVLFLFIIILSLTIYIFFSKAFIEEPEVSAEKIKELEAYFSEENRVAETEEPKDSLYVNSMSKSDWEASGLSEKQAGAVLNFRKKNGGFKSYDDLAQVYVLSDYWHAKNDSLVVFDEVDKIEETEPEEIIRINLNACTESELKQLKGIGDKRAEQIVQYRKKLGGYISVDQLLEIKYFDDEILELILPYIYVSGTPNVIDLNQVEAKVLWKHPYVRDWGFVNAVVNERDNYGKYQSLEELIARTNIDTTKLSKLGPYIEVK